MNLTSPPLPVDCTDTSTGTPFTSHFPNAPFSIEQYIPKDARTCPQPGVFAPNGLTPSPANLPGGCTRDIVHRFYQEQYQLHGGKQDLYVTGSDAVGLTHGLLRHEAAPDLRVPARARVTRDYVIADNFFQAAFGGSFLNHQWLIAAATPAVGRACPRASTRSSTRTGCRTTTRSTTPPGPSADPASTIACGAGRVDAAEPRLRRLRGQHDAADRTSRTSSDRRQAAAADRPTIGDRLSAAGVSWAWYSGGWSNANGDVGGPGWTNGTGPTCSDPNSSPNPALPVLPEQGVPVPPPAVQLLRELRARARAGEDAPARRGRVPAARRGLRTERCKLKPVSFIKPIGLENEHPGYTSETAAATTSSTCCRSIEEQPAQRTRW